MDTKTNEAVLQNDKIGNVTQDVISRNNYLYFLIGISLRFIQVKLKENLVESFEKENYSVNAASCEFLEFVLDFIQNKQRLLDIATFIVPTLLEKLDNSIDSNDSVMQVQLLNVLTVLYVNTQQWHSKNVDKVLPLFNNKKFTNCLVKGLQIKSYFTRSYFNLFIERCLPVMKNILSPVERANIATLLVSTTSKFLSTRIQMNSYLISLNSSINSSLGYSGDEDKAYIIKNY